MNNRFIQRIGLAIGLYFFFVVSFYLLQPLFIFQGDALAKDFTYQFEYPFDEQTLEVENGISLNLLHFPAKGERLGTILYFHGNADNLKRWGKYHTDFTSRGYDVWMYDYRGFGKSDGRSGDIVLYKDAKKVFDWVQQKYPTEELTLYGRSLGTSIASELATHVDCDSLILEAPFNNLDQLFRMKYPWLWQPFHVQFDFANDRHLALGIQAPIHIIHGTRDLVVPYSSSIYLKEYLLAKDTYDLIDGGGHKNLSEFAGFQRTLDKYL